jgi:hypothetical protein
MQGLGEGCEHTCSGRLKIQARAMDPSKYLAEILMDGTGRRAMNVARRPLPEGEHQSCTQATCDQASRTQQNTT